MKKCPIFPRPNESNKFSLVKFLFTKNRSWLGVLTPKSYSMKLGKFKARDSNVYILNDASEIRRIMIKEPDRFVKNEEYHEALESILGKSVFTTNDQQWQRQRKVVEPAFANDLAEFTFEKMDEAVNAMMQRIATFPQDEIVEADFQMRMVTSDIIYRTLFSDSIDEQSLKTILNAFESYQNASPLLSLLTVAKFKDNFIFKMLFKRRNKYSHTVREILDTKVEQRYKEYLAGKRQHDMLNAM